jgi:hypothetical protein
MGRDVAKTPFEVRRRALGFREMQVLAFAEARKCADLPSLGIITKAIGMGPEERGNLLRTVRSLRRKGLLDDNTMRE